MILLRFFCITLLTAVATATASCAATPTSASISYNLLRNGTHIGVISENFEIRNGAYSATSEATAIGLFALAQRRPIIYTSTGESSKDGLRPTRFESRRNNSVSTADFDWKSDKLTMTHDARDPGQTVRHVSIHVSGSIKAACRQHLGNAHDHRPQIRPLPL
jgi:hypothetical protein